MQPKVLSILDTIMEANKDIASAMSKKNSAKEELDEILNPFKINGLKSFIAKKVMEAMEPEYVEKIMKDRKDEIDNFSTCTSISSDGINNEINSVSYKISNIFDPERDSFEISYYLFNEDKTKVKFVVECLKNRSYMGITGSWIPKNFSSVWIETSELYKFDDFEEKHLNFQL